VDEWTTPLVALAVGLGGVALGHYLQGRSQAKADLRAQRQVLYAAIARFLVGLPNSFVAAMKASSTDDYIAELAPKLDGMRAELKLLGSSDVQQAWNALAEKVQTHGVQATIKRMKGEGKDTSNFLDVARRAYDDNLRAERNELFKAMRKDLRIPEG
jgi:hypothetical protein